MTDHVTLPTPTAEEQSTPGYRAADWALRNGTCPYSGGAHQIEDSPVISGATYCRLCRELETTLMKLSKSGGIYVVADDEAGA